MNAPADRRWRRGLFEPLIVHRHAPDGRVRRLRSDLLVVEALCDRGRFVRVDSWEDKYTDRCPDCGKLVNAEAGSDPQADSGTTPTAGD